MKKNLRNILALSLGLMTTVAFAQDWNVDSRTRMDMSEANGEGYKSTNQRVTLGATWEGDAWGIHVSSDVDYTLGANATASMSIYEAYASTDLMGYASLTAGRMAINNGSGALMSSNDWAASRTTWEGLKLGLNLDMADITVGYHRQNDGVDSIGGIGEAGSPDNVGNMWINASGEFSGWKVNLLYMTDEDSDNNATGIDISGEVMGAGISASMNTDFAENTMRVIGLSYAVNDDMGVSVSQTVYSETNGTTVTTDDGFNMAGTNMDGSWLATGGMGYLGAGDQDLAIGGTYAMAGFNLGVTMHKVTNSINDNADERDVLELSLGYSLNDNAGLSLKYATDATGDDEAKYMWVTLNVGL